MSAAPEVGPVLALVLIALAASAALLVRLGGLGLGRDMLVVSVRAAVQLAVVSLLIAAVLGSAGWTAAFVAGMVVVAAATAGKRITGAATGSGWWTVLSIAAGVAPVLTLLLASTLVPSRPVTLPGAFVGVLLGGADPVEAGAIQLLVLIGLLAIESIAVLITLELVATGRLYRAASDGRGRRVGGRR